jgi:peptide/nickel transport system permease protein
MRIWAAYPGKSVEKDKRRADARRQKADGRRFRLTPALPILVLILLIVAAVFAPLLTFHDPLTQNILESQLPPFWVSGGSTNHILGTDAIGRDLWARLIYGARTSLVVVIFALLIAVFLGTTVGLCAGYFGRSVDAVLMRLVDIVNSVPAILVAMAVAIAIGPSLRNVVMILGALIWPNIARLIRAEAMALKHNDFVRYAKAIAVPRWVILLRHLLPNVLPTLLVATTLETAHVILLEAALSFLGAGVPPPQPSWGATIEEGRALIATGWWISMFPGIAIVAVVLSLNSVGDWLRDRTDPRNRQM